MALTMYAAVEAMRLLHPECAALLKMASPFGTASEEDIHKVIFAPLLDPSSPLTSHDSTTGSTVRTGPPRTQRGPRTRCAPRTRRAPPASAHDPSQRASTVKHQWAQPTRTGRAA
jgi:hypothetical protein